ncbi:MAG: hypothetical protein GXP46_09380, partial [Deferribacteres bacterium]|nr:hypothetical protein [Deferribacteres bacterium]
MFKKLIYKELCIKSALIISILLSAATLYAGDVTLTWTPPTTNADGTPLTDLAGFKVYYGTASGNYSQVIDVNDPNQTQYQVTGLTNGQTYYFAVTAYDTSGNESDYSNEYAKTIESSSAAPVPDITVTVSGSPATSITFGDVTEGNSSSKTVTVKNDGNADLSVYTIAGSNPLSGPFSISNDNCSNQTVSPASSCT